MESGKLHLRLAVPSSISEQDVPESLTPAYQAADSVAETSPEDQGDDWGGVIFSLEREGDDWGGVIFPRGIDAKGILKEAQSQSQTILTGMVIDDRPDAFAVVQDLIGQVQEQGVDVDVRMWTYEPGLDTE